jgi:CDP-diacylglycerol--glycerol-3-phosphate 3-phosphatidyltransferase
MMTIPNILSFLRFPLAFLFLQENIAYRVFGIVLAMITDWLDGFLARRYCQTSDIGRLLDPVTDKFFVCFILVIFVREGQIKVWEALTFFTRDLSVLIFGSYLLYKDKLKTYTFRPFWSGKIITTLQLILLLALTLKYIVPFEFFALMLVLGCFSFAELFYKEAKEPSLY